MKTTFKTLIVAAAVLALASFSPLKEASAELTAKANHDHITIDSFYHGSEVSVRGICDPDVELVVKITSPEAHQTLKEKGKVGGFLWMNVGTLTIENTPNLYMLRASKDLGKLMASDELEKYTIGYPALGKHAELSPVADSAAKDKWFGEFIKFKEHSKLFESTDGGFTLGESGGKHTYYMKFAWPYQAPPGDYLVTVYAIKDGKVMEQATSKVMVEQVGVVKYLANMAKNNGALYGIFSILAALGAGFGVGLVFKKGGGAH